MKTAYKRASRVADQIRIEVAEILMRKTKDPRVGFVTVTDVELTNDLRLARIYVTTGPDDQHEAETFAGLAKAAGFIRAELGRRLHLRYTPELIFQKDITGLRGDRILTLLDEVATPDEKARQGGPEEASQASQAGAETVADEHERSTGDH
jgi:ribosome-binding factor A